VDWPTAGQRNRRRPGGGVRARQPGLGGARPVADRRTEEITLRQHRQLVLLASRGPELMIDLADLLGVSSSTATRHHGRLQRRGLIQREPTRDDRRAVRVWLTQAGARRAGQITDARRREISPILQAMPARSRPALLADLRSFNDGAGDVPEQSWYLGWGTDPAGSSRPAPTRWDARR
jgi:DNA-binding MarR family transcriptional regulator